MADSFKPTSGHVVDVVHATKTPDYCRACGDGNTPLKRCQGCYEARYCSVVCQKRHWSLGGHRNVCFRYKGGLITMAIKASFEQSRVDGLNRWRIDRLNRWRVDRLSLLPLAVLSYLFGFLGISNAFTGDSIARINRYCHTAFKSVRLTLTIYGSSTSIIPSVFPVYLPAINNLRLQSYHSFHWNFDKFCSEVNKFDRFELKLHTLGLVLGYSLQPGMIDFINACNIPVLRSVTTFL